MFVTPSTVLGFDNTVAEVLLKIRRSQKRSTNPFVTAADLCLSCDNKGQEA